MIKCLWTGVAFEPYNKHARSVCDERFGQGEIVIVEAELERSWISHKHQFAQIADMWSSLPESVSSMPYAATPDTLRKHALIATGHHDCETIDAGSDEAAERVSAYVGSLARKAHGYCIVSVNGPVVRCWTPHSQSVRAMGKARFQKSKSDVLDWIGALLMGDENERTAE